MFGMIAYPEGTGGVRLRVRNNNGVKVLIGKKHWSVRSGRQLGRRETGWRAAESERAVHKQNTGLRLKALAKTEDQSISQRSFWDGQMWSNHACDVKWLYVRNNLVRHGPANHAPDDCPFQDVMNSFG